MGRTRHALALGSAVAVLATLLVSGGAPGDVRALNVEQVTTLDLPGQTTHFEFLTREIAGVPHTLILQGTRPDLDGEGGGLAIVDVTEPASPALLAFVPCATTNNDVASVPVDLTIGGFAYDRIVAMASNSAAGCFVEGKKKGGGVAYIGLRTVPEPGQLVTADYFGNVAVNPNGTAFRWTNSPAAHTVVAHPNRAIVYAGNQVLGDRSPTVEVINLEVWPPVVRSVDLPPTGVGPHDITFRPDGTRAYASSINASFVWDTTDPLSPVTLGVIDSANLKIHHEATLHPDGRHLIVVDEFVNTSAENVGQCPGGGLHVFDLGPYGEFEKAPIPVGQFYASDLSSPGFESGVRLDVGCTAHEFNVSPDGRWMPIGWTGAGVRVIDLSDLWRAAALPAPTPVVLSEIGYFQPVPNDTWAAKVHGTTGRYIFASDTINTFRVLRFTGLLP